MQKIIVIGSNGMLGSEVTAFFVKKKCHVVGLDRADEFDFTDKNIVKNKLEELKPDVVINCAAFTDVDGCETEKGLSVAKSVNAQAPVDLVEICLELNIACIHISTDYIFGDNISAGHIESDLSTGSMNAYGQTKLEAEKGITELCGGLEEFDKSSFDNKDSKVYIIRISWLFGKGGENFVNKIITKAKNNEDLSVVDDEVGCPTYTYDVAKAMDYILEDDLKPGIYHVTSNNSCSRYDFAKYIINKIYPDINVKPCELADFSRKAKVPNFSILRNRKLPKQRSWEEMVDDFSKKL